MMWLFHKDGVKERRKLNDRRTNLNSRTDTRRRNSLSYFGYLI